MNPKHVLLLLVAGFAAIIITNSVFIVSETNQAMVLQLGEIKRLEATPGLKFRTPFLQQVMHFDKRILETDSAAEEVQSKDKKRLVVDSFTRWRIQDAKKFYETVRTEYQARERLNIIVNSNLRQKLALYSLVDIVSGDREQIMDDILTSARNEAKSLGVQIVDVRIKRADLPEANSRAVFERMNAEREQEAKQIRAKGAEDSQVITADAERQRTILLAEAQRDAQKLRGHGDAAAIKISASAFGRDPHFFEFTRSLDAYKNSLANQETFMVLDPSLDFFKHLKAR